MTQAPVPSQPWLRFLLSGLLAASIVGVFGGTLTLPPVLDDWQALYGIAGTTPSEWLRQELWPVEMFRYWPARNAYFVLWYHWLGAQPLPFRAGALLMHYCSALLVVGIVKHLIDDSVLAWTSGFIYATAATVHLHVLTWLVGIADSGAALFGLATMWFVLRHRFNWAAAAYALALGFKESVVALPLIALWYCALFPRSGWLAQPGEVVSRIKWLALVGLAYGALRYVQMASNPDWPGHVWYAMSFAPIQVLRTISTYAVVSVEIFLPLALPAGKLGYAVADLLLLSVLGLAVLWSRNETVSLPSRGRLVAFLCGWFVLGLGPVLFLRYIHSAYYLSYSLCPLIVLVLIAINATLARLGCQRAAISALTAAVAIVCVGSAAYSVQRQASADIPARHYPPGLPILQRAQLVSRMQAGLLQALPAVHGKMNLLTDGIDLWAFGRECGPRLWFHDPQLEVFDINYLGPCARGCCIRNHPVSFLSGLDGTTLATEDLHVEETKIVQLCGTGVCVRNLSDLVDEQCQFTLTNWPRYEPGDTMTFRGDGGVVFSGWAPPEDSFRWSLGAGGTALFQLDQRVAASGEYALEIAAGTLGRQRLRALLNDQDIGETTLEGFDRHVTKLVFEGRHLLPGQVNRLSLLTPDAHRAPDGDARILGIALASLRIDPVQRPTPGTPPLRDRTVD